jgi:enterochelin esterase-like enzyme
VTGPLPEASGDGGAAPGHDPRRSTPYPLIVAFDGVDYRDTMPLPLIRDANRRLRNALSARGYDVTYTEVPGGNHAPQWWRGSPRRTPPGAP